METKVYYASTDSIDKNLDAYINMLPDNLKGRIQKISDLNAKVCSLGGALLLDIAAKEFGEDISKVVYNPKGKPYIPESDFYFSISHTDGYAAISFGKTPSGCDIQIKKDVNFKIAQRFFSEKEYASISDSDDFFKIWCRKESAYKISGVNYCTELNEQRYVFSDHRLKDDLYMCVCTTNGKMHTPELIDFNTVL